MRGDWRLSPWAGASLGVVAAVMLAWLVREGAQVLRSAMRASDPAESEGALMGAFWLLFALGLLLVVVAFAAQLHPLIAVVPAAWFLVVFGPLLFGGQGIPDWYPEWVASYFRDAGGEAGFVVSGVLVAATAAAYVLRRLSMPEPARDDAAEAQL